MKQSKISPALAGYLEKAQGGAVELVVELRPIHPSQISAGSREERLAWLREAFQRKSAPVEAAIRSVGGEVLGGVWLNQTLRVRMPVGLVSGLVAVDEVALLDLPRPLRRANR